MVSIFFYLHGKCAFDQALWFSFAEMLVFFSYFSSHFHSHRNMQRWRILEGPKREGPKAGCSLHKQVLCEQGLRGRQVSEQWRLPRRWSRLSTRMHSRDEPGRRVDWISDPSFDHGGSRSDESSTVPRMMTACPSQAYLGYIIWSVWQRCKDSSECMLHHGVMACSWCMM
jgi:hypothetical protein